MTITGNTAHENLLGLEVENSGDVTVTKNQIFNNTLGMVADINAGLQKKDQTNVLISAVLVCWSRVTFSLALVFEIASSD